MPTESTLGVILFLVAPFATGIIGAFVAITATRRSGRSERENAMTRVARELVDKHRIECPFEGMIASAVADRRREVAEMVGNVKRDMTDLVAQERQERTIVHQDILDLRSDVRSIREMLVEVASNIKRMNGNAAH